MRNFIKRFVNSAGAIVFLERKGRTYVLMIQNEKQAWSFPKGHVRFGEKTEKAAVREVLEETGIRIKIRKGFRTEVPSAIKKDHRKIIFFIGKAVGGSLKPLKSECMDAAWIPHERVRDLMRFPIDYQAYIKAYQSWKEGRP